MHDDNGNECDKTRTRHDVTTAGGTRSQTHPNPIHSNPPAQVAQNLKVPPSRAAASKRATLMVQLAKEMSMGVDPILQVCGAVYVDYNISITYSGI